MSSSSSTSFIPKHTPNKPERRSSPRQVFFGTLLVRILFVSVIIAAGGVYLYLGKLDRELMVEVTNFDAATSNYEKDTDKLDAIVAMDNRLKLAGDILRTGVSLNTLFTALERSVIGTVQLSSLSLTYDEASELQLIAQVDTDSFDSTMFQRSVLGESEVFKDARIDDVTIMKQGGESEDDEEARESISFTATIIVDPMAVPAVVVRDSIFVPLPEAPSTTAEPVTVDGESVEDESTTETEGADGSGESVVNVGFGS